MVNFDGEIFFLLKIHPKLDNQFLSINTELLQTVVEENHEQSAWGMSSVKICCSYMIIQDHIFLNHSGKRLWNKYESFFFPYPPYSSDLGPSIIFFRSFATIFRRKMKRLKLNSFALKPEEFYVCEINKLPNRCD